MLVLFWISIASVSGFAQQPALTGNETPLIRRLTELLRGIGLEYRVTADPAIQERDLPPGLQLGSPETFFDILLPSQGWTYDMLGAKALQLQPSQTPWPGPSTLNRKIPSPFSEIRQKTTLENLSAQAAAQQLRNAFGMTVLLDCRIDPSSPLRGRIEADSLENALNQLERGERWQWHVAEQIVLLMPGEEDRVLGLPNRGDRALIYADTPLSVAAEQLHSLFGIGMELPPALADTKITGAFKGATLGELLEGVCKSADCAFRVAGGKVVFGSKEEIAQLPRIAPAPSGPRNFLLRVEVLEVPAKRWEEFDVSRFLSSMPPPTFDEQEASWNKVDRASGVKVFGAAEAIVPGGSEYRMHFPMMDVSDKQLRERSGYFFLLRPASAPEDVIQIDARIQYLGAEPRKPEDALLRPSLYEQPLRAQLWIGNGKRALLHGAAREVKKGRKNYFLISIQPTLSAR